MSAFPGELPFELARIYEEIKADYGHDVRIKPKRLFKFGRTTNADSGVKTTVANFQGSEVNETFASTNSIDSLIADNAADNSNVTIRVEGHYLNGDDNLQFHAQNITLNGQTRVALTQNLVRCTRLKNVTTGTLASPAQALVGNVYAYDNTVAGGATAGVPDDATATKCMIVAGKQQSEKCATTLSYEDYWIITHTGAGFASATGGGNFADVEIEMKPRGGVWTPAGVELGIRSSGGRVFLAFEPYLIIPTEHDIRMVVTTNVANGNISRGINGYLAKVI